MHFDFITNKLGEFFEIYKNEPISEKGWDGSGSITF
jgi:hypothetical protein